MKSEGAEKGFLTGVIGIDKMVAFGIVHSTIQIKVLLLEKGH